MRLGARDAGSYSHQVELLSDRPVFSGLHQCGTNATSTCPGTDNQSDDFHAFTRLQQQASLGGNPPNDARVLLGYDDEARVGAEEHAEPLSYLIDRRGITQLRGEATDRLGIGECCGTKADGGVQNCYLVGEGLADGARPSPSPRQTSS